jgi:hypothetical protein
MPHFHLHFIEVKRLDMIRALLARVVSPEDGQLMQVGCVYYVITCCLFLQWRDRGFITTFAGARH